MAQRFCPLREPADASYAQLMELSDEQTKDFIECWRRDFGEELAPDTARAEAMRLLDFFATLADAFASPQTVVTEAEDGAPTTK